MLCTILTKVENIPIDFNSSHYNMFYFLQRGPSETNAALEFAVNTLEVSEDFTQKKKKNGVVYNILKITRI